MKNNISLIRVAVPSPVRHFFDYLPPPNISNKLSAGMRVRIPFGRKSVIGIVVGEISQSAVPLAKLKRIDEVLDTSPIFTDTLFKLLRWTADYYQHSLGEVLFQALPVWLRQGKLLAAENEIFWCLTAKGKQIESKKMLRAPKQWQVLQQLRELMQRHQNGAGLSTRELTILGIEMRILHALQAKQLLYSEKQPRRAEKTTKCIPGPGLNVDQQNAVTNVLAAREHFQPFLLQGVTGSGKTEVYLSIMEKLLTNKQQALVLVPEIALMPQMLHRFRDRLPNNIGVLHSGLTDKQRLQIWQAAHGGELSIVIGTRSAIFTPFKDLRLIVVDESHDMSFKQWDGFKYHARDVAVRRAQLKNIPIIMGSATPALSSLHNVIRKRFQLLSLPKRAGVAQPMRINMVDLGQQKTNEGFALSVLQAMQTHLARGEQVLVFINRRGYAPMVMCTTCGWTVECERCQAPLTLHYHPQHLQCHHCGKKQSVPSQCADCGEQCLSNIGFGTQRIEQFLQRYFKRYKTVRIDRDATRRKGMLQNKLQAIQRGEAQILLGTQMLAKGHHFPNVTLAVVLNVDGGLYSVDYAGTERMAQLLLQVAGRVGRAEKLGTVLLQTHHPHHPLLQTLVHKDYATFAAQALQERQAACLPPYCYFALFRSEAVVAEKISVFLSEVKAILEEQHADVQILGPLPAPIEKRLGRFRWQLLLSADKRSGLHQLLQHCLPIIEELKSSRRVRWSIDVDPVDML